MAKTSKKSPVVSVTIHYKIEREGDDYSGVDLQQLKAVLSERLYHESEIQTIKLDGDWLSGFKTKCRLLRPEAVADHLNKG